MFIVLFSLFGAIVSPRLGFFNDKARRYDGEWVIETKGYSEKAFIMPALVDIEDVLLDLTIVAMISTKLKRLKATKPFITLMCFVLFDLI